mmetsp:Transcript_22054/g.68460  ORF Transcript_22054/g.68460 Transcript_22054/m.68460 type:complete len:264 (-) Transcript_22054:976-1767(-)
MGRVAVRLGGWSDGNGKVGVGVVVDRILLRHEHRLRHEAADPVELLVHLVVRLLQRRHLGHRRHALVPAVVVEVRRPPHALRDGAERREQQRDRGEGGGGDEHEGGARDTDGDVAGLHDVADDVRLWDEENEMHCRAQVSNRDGRNPDEVLSFAVQRLQDDRRRARKRECAVIHHFGQRGVAVFARVRAAELERIFVDGDDARVAGHRAAEVARARAVGDPRRALEAVVGGRREEVPEAVHRDGEGPSRGFDPPHEGVQVFDR